VKITTLTALALLLTGTVAVAECTQPEVPELPNGAEAALEDMLAGQKAMKAFQTANADYRTCLEQAYEAAAKAATKGSKDAKEEAKAAYAAGLDAYNEAVATEEEVAGQFNTEIREYKAANPS